MATDSMFLRIVGGNAVDPQLTDNKVSGHTFISLLQAWKNGEIDKATLVVTEDFTHADDSGDLDNLRQWYLTANAAGLGSEFFNVLENRIILARDKRLVGGGVTMDGKLDFAVKNTFINGADGAHSLRDTGPIARRFTTWAAPV